MNKRKVRPAMTMIELIFAIIIIAISILSIPSMMMVANDASKVAIIDDDVLSRLNGWLIDKSQARWDGNYGASDSGPLWITGTSDLNCSRGSGVVWYRRNIESTVPCDDLNRTPSIILNPFPDGNLSKGIERLNGGSETITVTPSGGTPYSVTASYAVSYVPSSLTAVNGNTATATWQLGSSATMAPNPAANSTHLKRIVTRFSSSDTDITLTFFKSNKGN